MTVVEAMENALGVLRTTAYDKGFVRTCENLAAAVALMREQYPLSGGGTLPEQKKER